MPKYFFKKEFKKSNKTDFIINKIGIREEMPPGRISRQSGTNDYLFMFFYNKMYLRVNEKFINSSPHTFVIWHKNSPQFYENRVREWLHSWIHCDGKWLIQKLKENKIKTNTFIRLNDSSSLENYLYNIFNELMRYDNTGDVDEVVIKNNMECLIRKFNIRIASGKNIPEKIIKIRQYLDTGFTKPLNLSDLAAISGLTPPYICEQFKHYYLKSPLQYIINIRMNYARHLLEKSSLKIMEIAFKCGYQSTYHFSRMFKRYFRTSARGYRLYFKNH